MAPGSALTLPLVGDMVIATLDALGLDRVVVAANDSGGAITQYLLGAHADRFTAALLTPTETPGNFPPSFFRYLFPPLLVRSLMWLAAQSLRSNLGRRSPITFGYLIHRSLERAEATRLMGPLWSSPGARSDLRRLLAGLDPSAMGPVLEAASRFTGPVDVAWSAGDRIFPDADADLLAATYPAGRRVPDITDAASISPLDRPDAVADRLLALVDRLVSTDAGTEAGVLV